MVTAKTSQGLPAVQKGIKIAFGKVRQELDDHLDSINANSDEIKSLYDYLISLESKLDKLSEHLEERPFAVKELSLREQEIFILIYQNELPISIDQIATQLGFTPHLVSSVLDRLAAKGVPMLRYKHQKTQLISLEDTFRQRQAKENLITVDKRIVSEVYSSENK